ncbi:MAG TPA: DUF3996 domain-containing protein [Kofleriaceae bacterium]|nr:DUF3996 domain-containing protein [Kofleriaceae bacterium]
MRTASLFAISCGIVLAASAADARPRPAGIHGKRFEANKVFGLGLELGEPTAITGKWFYASDKAIDFGVGDVYDYYNYRGFTMYADHLWHPVSLASAEQFELPFYIGVGGRYWRFDDYRGPGNVYGDALGVRVPIGIAFDFNNVPLDVFVQIVPTVDLFFDVPAGYDRSFYLWFDASIGARYYFF